MTSVLRREEKRRHTQEQPTEVTGRDWSNGVLGQLESPEAGRAQEGSSPRASGGSVTLSTPSLWTSGLRNCEIIGFKQPTLW